MSLVIDKGQQLCANVIGPTVFSIGQNQKYIVAKQHPSTDEFGGFNKTKTNYFVVRRSADGVASGVPDEVLGPLSAADFASLAKRNGLPSFSKTFKDLE
jgi:hypothetical protein